MKKKTESWDIRDLQKRFVSINFPEYQREPNIWARIAKQRLVDSILRQFDIASLYFYSNKDGSLDCIDGRQRINAIMAFLGENANDADNGFALRILNEIYEDTEHPFEELDGQTFAQLEEMAASTNGSAGLAKDAIEKVLNYKFTAVLLAEAKIPEEFNLQFTRLNLGTIINAGEKLHAMVGAMRDVCFDDPKIGKHHFLDMVKIPTRRYAKEQVAAQVLAQVFSRKFDGQFTRTRHFDLQRFMKEHATLSETDKRLIEEVRTTFDALAGALGETKELLRNRAIAVSTVLLAWERRLHKEAGQLEAFAKFLKAFLGRLRWQVAKGLDVDGEYRYLIDFQRHVTQASVEKPAVDARFATMEKEFKRWLTYKKLQGDKEFYKRTHKKPQAAT